MPYCYIVLQDGWSNTHADSVAANKGDHHGRQQARFVETGMVIDTSMAAVGDGHINVESWLRDISDSDYWYGDSSEAC